MLYNSLCMYLLVCCLIACTSQSTDEGDVNSIFPVPPAISEDEKETPTPEIQIAVVNPPVPEPIVEPVVAAELMDNIAPQIINSSVRHGDIDVDRNIERFVFTFSEDIAATNFIKLVDNTTGLNMGWIPFIRDGEIELTRLFHNLGAGLQLIAGHVYTVEIRVADVAHNWTQPLNITFVTAVAPAHIFEEIGRISFRNDIQPILTERCAIPGCHAAPGAKGLDLTQYDTFKKGGNGGPTFIAGNGKGSLVVERIDGGGMPPIPPPLNAEQIQLFIDWIDEGAVNN